MNFPKISIVTVVKNGMPYLSDCLKSVQLQDYKNKEHIIIYSSSQDNTEEFLLYSFCAVFFSPKCGTSNKTDSPRFQHS